MRSMRSRPRVCKPTARIHFQSVIEEESTGVGALSTLQRGYRADACFIPEPTGGKMVRSQVGVIWFRLKVRGFPVHVFEAGAGANAIMAAYHLIHSLEKLEAEWNERAKRSPLQGGDHPINFNPGIIKGGDWASSVPAWCDVDCRIAVLPGWSVADCQKEILACVSAAARDHRFLSNNPPEVEWSGFLSEGYELTDSAEPEAAFGKAFGAVYGGAVPDRVFTALTDTRFYGLNYNIPSLCFGANGAAMHGFNEYVELESLRKSTKATALFIAEWCGVEKAVARRAGAQRAPAERSAPRSLCGITDQQDGLVARSSALHPANFTHPPQRLHDRIQPVGQRRRARLQDQRRLDLDDAVVAHRRDVAPARPLPDPVGHDLLAAPGGEDHVGRGVAHDIGRNDPVLGRLLKPQFWQHVLAAGDLDQFGHPADAGDQGIVPFLEIDFWLWRWPRRRGDTREALLRSRVASCSARSAAPTIAPSVRIIAKMPAMSRWLKTWMATPARTRSATMSACRSEKASTRSGCSARIFGISAEMKADTRGFSRRTCGGRTA